MTDARKALAEELVARADKYLNTGSGEYASDILRDMVEFIRRSSLPGTREEVARVEMQMAQLHAIKDMEIAALLDLLERAKSHVKASCGADHMIEGFGPRKTYPSDVLLADIETALSGRAALPPAPMPERSVSDEDWQRALDCAHSQMEGYHGKLQISTEAGRKAALDDAMQHAFGLLSLRVAPMPEREGMREMRAALERAQDVLRRYMRHENDATVRSSANAVLHEIKNALTSQAWDAGEYEGCGKDSERAFKAWRYKGTREALTLARKEIERQLHKCGADEQAAQYFDGLLAKIDAALAPHDKTEG